MTEKKKNSALPDLSYVWTGEETEHVLHAIQAANVTTTFNKKQSQSNKT